MPGKERMMKAKWIENQRLWLAAAAVALVELLIIFIPIPIYLKVILILGLNALCALGVLLALRRQKKSEDEMIKIATHQAELGTSSAINTLPIGIVAFNAEHKLLWANPYAVTQLGKSEFLSTTRGIEQLIAISQKKKPWFYFKEQHFQVEIDHDNRLIYFQDVTNENTLLEKIESNQLVIGILAIDNYDEATDKMDEKGVSYLNSFLTTYISDWMSEYHVFYKRINSERYFFTCEYRNLQAMMDKKFDLLEILRKATNEQDIPITISMGVAYEGSDAARIGHVAQSNLEMALVRGGDQVVVKPDGKDAKAQYFGGKATSNIKRTRVRSRAIGTALGDLIDDADAVYIMGHQYPDMDAIGAAVGVAVLARFHQKEAWIIIDETKIIPDVEKALKEIQKYPELAQLIISPAVAFQKKTNRSLLAMVDHNKPSLGISEVLGESFEKVAIIDHHRRGEEFPAQPLLVYIESSASSTSELVAELIDFEDNRTHQMTKVEATFLYAGIVVDTRSFKVRTTSRTFDIASYLKGQGADLTLVEYLLSSDLHNYLEMSQLIAKSEYLAKDIVLVSGDEGHRYDPVTSAKAADTLLGLQDISASFVVTERLDGKIGISARSNGSINVQIIMEDMGGGGHFTNAAVQLEHTTVATVKAQLLTILKQNADSMHDNNA